MSDDNQRLETALMLYMEWQGSGRDARQFLDEHEDYRDLLEPMIEDEVEEEGAPYERLGEYRLLREVGRGGMGVVYEAEQTGLGRRVALKVLPAHLTLDETTILRFQREARLAARLEHKGIVAVHGVGKAKEAYYFAMDYVQGEPLSARIREARQAAAAKKADDETASRFGTRRWIDDSVEIVAQVADALAHAHEQGILHRDIKPSNIILREDGTPVLTDFGLAREEGLPSMTLTGDFAGTPYYVSPEQAQGRTDLDVRTDIFSLGVTLYELLTLHRPFEGETPQQVIQRILQKEPRDPRKHGVELPQDLLAILERCLEKDRNRRYASVADLAADLRAFLAYKPVSARRIGQARRLWRWAQRNPIVAGLSLALLLSLVISLVVVLDRNRSLSRSLLETQLLLDARLIEDYADQVLHLEVFEPEHAQALKDWIQDVEAIEARRIEYKTVLDARRHLDAADDSTLRKSLERLDRRLTDMTRPKTGSIALVARWLEGVSHLEERSLQRPKALWDAALADMAREDSPYKGLEMQAQMGLVPVGKDSKTGLWEFAHILSGEVPQRDETGRLRMRDDTAIIFVLLPAATTTMGCRYPDKEHRDGDPWVDAWSQTWEQPPTEVELAPFFLSKYEMTQGQWLRITGENPSYFQPGNSLKGRGDRKWEATLLHPVEMMHQVRAGEIMKLLGMRLPTEAQWEYAARAGTTTRYWTGHGIDSLRFAENLADRALLAHLPPATRIEGILDYDDGHARHAPVGSFRANPFGFYDMLGNVAEFTSSYISSYTNPKRKGDGQFAWRKDADPVLRGGSYMWPAGEARCSARDTLPKWSPAHSVGLRPARPLR